ncbi:hypothetical protein FSP39_018768 [Pinctada imbricata]|uniref:Uncharacterized protein n=1 Tax=Pinctada imbricata TaxID=66713 RepID=A0AA88YU96_PINIB|nr:hypothetical protein FSP39_018768 [Pinctada imbricata]
MEERTTTDYARNFDPEWFLSHYHCPVDDKDGMGQGLKSIQDTLHDLCSQDVRFGERLLDVGTGPTVHSVLRISREVRDIDLSDYTPGNIQILKDWKDGKRNEEMSLIQYEMKLVGDTRPVEEREQELRDKVKGIYAIDVTTGNVFIEHAPKNPSYDVITSLLCLEAVSDSREVYKKCLANVTRLVKEGGYIIMLGVLESTFYKVGSFRFPCAPITAEDVIAGVKANGFKVIKFTSLPTPGMEDNEFSDCKATFGILAQKST